MALDSVLNERQGFANKVTGGQGGKVVTVTTSQQLTSALAGGSPAWIMLDAGTYKGRFTVGSNKTLQAKGPVTIVGDKGGMVLEGSNNVIMLGLNFDGGNPDWKHDNEGSDGLQIRDSDTIWIHHCRFAQWKDGCIDAKEDVKNLSVTWCRFEKNFQALLWMANPATLAYCYCKDVARRFPKVVGGKVHAVNNVIDGWADIEIECARDKGQLLSEYSMFLPTKLSQAGRVVTQGRINSTHHYTKGAVSFLNHSIDAKFMDDARACIRVTKPKTKAAWESLLRSVKGAAGDVIYHGS